MQTRGVMTEQAVFCGLDTIPAAVELMLKYACGFLAVVGDSGNVIGAITAVRLEMAGFQRFPSWMWRNADVLDFVGWLRENNGSSPDGGEVGFYGLGLYSMHAPLEAVLAYLDSVDPEGAGARGIAMPALSISGKILRSTRMRLDSA